MEAALVISLSLALLYILSLMMPSTDYEGFFVVSEGTWSWSEGDFFSSIPVKAGSSLHTQLSPSNYGTPGKYVFRINKTKITSMCEPLCGIYFPALGGKFKVKINGESIPIPKDDYSTIGPVIPLEPFVSSKSDFLLEISLQRFETTYDGLWRGPLVFGNLLNLSSLQRADFDFLVFIPIFETILLLFGAIVFAVVYWLTDRQFKPYLVYSSSFLIWAIFYIYLSGIARQLNLSIGFLTHFPVRIAASVAPFLIISSFQSLYAPKSLHLSRKSLFLTTIFFICVSLLSFFSFLNGFWTAGLIGAVLTMPLAGWPLFRWPFRKVGKFSLGFLCHVVAMTATLGWISDSLKIALRLMHFSYPINYLDRGTSPLLFGFSFWLFVLHFVRLNAVLAKERVESSRNLSLARIAQQVAHDVRYPFSALQMAINALPHVPQSEIPSFLESMRDSVSSSIKKADAILKDIMDFGKTSNLIFSENDLEKLIREVVADVRGCYLEKKIEVDLDLQPLRRKIDRSKIYRVVFNIVENACAATTHDGYVKIRLFTKGDRAVISVFNEGSYVPPEKTTLIFDEYFTEGKHEGTGLGLSIARRLVEEHGGSISCKSEKGAGTTFEITLD